MSARKCPACEYRNASQARFCVNCGDELVVEPPRRPHRSRDRDMVASGKSSRYTQADDEVTRPSRVTSRIEISEVENESYEEEQTAAVEATGPEEEQEEAVEEVGSQEEERKQPFKRWKKAVPSEEEDEKPARPRKHVPVPKVPLPEEDSEEDEESYDEFDDEDEDIPPQPPARRTGRELRPYQRRLPARIPSKAVGAYRTRELLDPYYIDPTLDGYQDQIFVPKPPEREPTPQELQPWLTHRFPWHFPRRRPDLAGKIVHIQSEMQFPDYPNVLRALVDILSEMIWMVPNEPTHREGEKIQVTILRIRTPEGGIRDARTLGFLRGANLSLGDTVALWGWKRRGSLTVRMGYNHTSQAVVITNIISMLLPALIILGVLAVFIGVDLAWSHISFLWVRLFLLK